MASESTASRLCRAERDHADLRPRGQRPVRRRVPGRRRAGHHHHPAHPGFHGFFGTREQVGNRLVRGAAAAAITEELAARSAARGGDGRAEVGGEPLYVVTADDEDWADRQRPWSTSARLIACRAVESLSACTPFVATGDEQASVHRAQPGFGQGHLARSIVDLASNQARRGEGALSHLCRELVADQFYATVRCPH